jgi:hypothetical protein
MEKQFHQRLILIDGINIMEEFKECVNANQNKCDRRMDAMVLLPLVHDIVQHGFRLKIIMKKMPDKKEVSNRYVLTELDKMNLLIFPHYVCHKSDDILMLSFAEEYGAIIISNRIFEVAATNEYQNIIENNIIKYTNSCNYNFTQESFEDELDYPYLISLINGNDNEKFYCYDNDPDYGKVKVSYNVFRSISAESIKNLDFLLIFMYAKLCSERGISRPLALNFFEKDEEIPARFDEFKSRFFPGFC